MCASECTKSQRSSNSRADLGRRAQALSADQKQKISLGRGLVRPDVAAVLFDEPLTVIDPHLKWLLRRKLKQIHEQLRLSFIYVTHDQTEALTFADRVVVMTHGEVVQVGTPEQLFETPAHRFVGHFIGYARHELHSLRLVERRRSRSAMRSIETVSRTAPPANADLARGRYDRSTSKLRHERGANCVPAAIITAQDHGAFALLQLDVEGAAVWARLSRPRTLPTPGPTYVRFQPATVRALRERGEGRMSASKPINQRAWWFVLPVLMSVAFSAVIPLMTVVNYSVQDIFGPEQRVFVGIEWYREVLRDAELHAALLSTAGFLGGRPVYPVAARRRPRPRHAGKRLARLAGRSCCCRCRC